MNEFDEVQIAKVCHDANRSYCESIGDHTQQRFEDAPLWQRESAIKGVQFHLKGLRQGIDPSPSASHESWLEEKRMDGWKWGSVKNPDKKEHPCYVPYHALPLAQQMKDYIFAGIVKAFYMAVNQPQLAKSA